MSAVSGDSVASNRGDTHVFEWNQNVPVPAYLIALAAGHLRSSDISDRVRIWAEPSVLSDAANEFSETEVSGGLFSIYFIIYNPLYSSGLFGSS
jgi:leukotriene-A4 hydrolase